MELTTREAAARLGVSQARVRVLINSGGLTARRVGTLWLIDAASVEHQRGLTSAGATSRAMSPRVAWALLTSPTVEPRPGSAPRNAPGCAAGSLAAMRWMLSVGG